LALLDLKTDGSDVCKAKKIAIFLCDARALDGRKKGRGRNCNERE
jgi:hypothetical protein